MDVVSDGTTGTSVLNEPVLFALPSPGFARLSLVDQMSLLQSGWMEALLVGVAWRSQATSGEELAFAENLRLDEAQCRAAGLAELYAALRHLTAKYCALGLSGEEAVALKAVALANSGTAAADRVQTFQPFFFTPVVHAQAPPPSCGAPVAPRY